MTGGWHRCRPPVLASGERRAAHQALAPSLVAVLPEEGTGDVVLQEAVSISGKGTGVEAALDHVHVEEPAAEEVVVELLAERALTPDAVQRD